MIPFNQKVVSQRIRYLRKDKHHLSRREFADKAGLSLRSIEAYEQYSVCPGSFAVFAICSTFNASADWLLGLSDKE